MPNLQTVSVQIAREPHAADLPLPEYETELAAGMDLRAAVQSPLHIAPGQRALISTGIRIALPPGTEAQVRPRSGLALRQGITLVNTPGTVDADYRGEIRVILINHGTENVTIHRGDRIAQLVVSPVLRAQWEVCESLEDTPRGVRGFGHTGGT